MNYNDVMRRVRYTFDFSDAEMIEIYSLAGHVVNRSQVSDWLKKDTDPQSKELTSEELALFLNGFITLKRGKKEGATPPPEKRLNNNTIFRKLKIALNLRDQDILDILMLADLRVSKHELSAFFRNTTHRQYRLCKDQILRNFLHGMQIKYRDNKE